MYQFKNLKEIETFLSGTIFIIFKRTKCNKRSSKQTVKI